MSLLFRNLVRFGRLLHAAGLDVPAGRMIDVASALDHIDIGRRSDFYYALRSLLVHRRQDLPIFDEMFRAFWREPRHRPPPTCARWAASDRSAAPTLSSTRHRRRTEVTDDRPAQ